MNLVVYCLILLSMGERSLVKSPDKDGVRRSHKEGLKSRVLSAYVAESRDSDK